MLHGANKPTDRSMVQDEKMPMSFIHRLGQHRMWHGKSSTYSIKRYIRHFYRTREPDGVISSPFLSDYLGATGRVVGCLARKAIEIYFGSWIG